MNEYIVKIIKLEEVTHDVKKIRTEKPAGYKFIPGQATDLSINLPELKNEKRPFSFTCLNSEPYLEFIIKIYKEHNGITSRIAKMNPGDEMIIGYPWGAIAYKGPGIFIAGGAGITPFISIFRQLYKDEETENNKLFFSNKTSKDIIISEELNKILKSNFINVITRENQSDFDGKRIDKNFLKENILDFNSNFYICGPDLFVSDIKGYLEELGAKTEGLVIET